MNKLQAIVTGVLIAAGLLYLIFFMPPSSLYIIILFIALATTLTYIVSGLLTTKRYQYTAASFVLLELSINYLAGFQILNTILLISIIIGLEVLFKDKKD